MLTLKVRYHTNDAILAENAVYNMLLGERSNGKSYSVKDLCLRGAYHNKEEFIYLRRWELEIKPNLVESYFSDSPITTITNGEYNSISVYRRNIFFANTDEDGKVTRGKRIGYCIYLSGAEHFKSTQYPKVTNMIFEEFVTNSMYLPNECDTLMQLVSTIFRNRQGRVWLIGNTISRVCPYFHEWQLKNIPTQKQGTIDVYNQQTETGVVKVAVEYCATSKQKNNMFFGKSEKNITTGAWDCEPQPHLPKSFKDYEVLYKMLYKYRGFSYVVNVLKDNETGENTLFIYEHTGKGDFKRVITDVFTLNPLHTEFFEIVTQGDRAVDSLYKRNKICFSDNLTGSEFKDIIKQKGGF